MTPFAHRRTAGALVGIAVASLALAACGGGGAADTSSGPQSTLKVAVSFSIGSLDPQQASDLADSVLSHNVSQALVEPSFAGDTATTVPMLAKSWTQDNATTWTFHLQTGVKFSNGEPFDAAAAKYSIDRFLDPKTQAGHAGFLKIKSTAVVDPSTLRITTDGPFPDILRGLYAVGMVPPKLTAGDPDAFAKKPVGTGPFEIENSSQDEITLTANPTYWNKAHSTLVAQTVVLESRPEDATRVAALSSGEVDMAQDIPLESLSQVPSTASVPANENLMLILNGQNGVFTNEKIREAVAIGTDVNEIRKSIYSDDHSRDTQCQVAPKFTVGFNPSLTTPAFDADKAKELIQESGYSGQTVTMIGPKGHYPKGDEVIQAVAAQWQSLGLKVKLELLPEDAWLKLSLGEQQGDKAVHQGFDADLAAVGAFSLTAAEPLTSLLGGGPFDMFPHDQYPQISQQLSKVQQDADAPTQSTDLQELAAEVCDSHAFLPVVNYDRIWGLKKGEQFTFRPDARIMLDKEE